MRGMWTLALHSLSKATRRTINRSAKGASSPTPCAYAGMRPSRMYDTGSHSASAITPAPITMIRWINAEKKP